MMGGYTTISNRLLVAPARKLGIRLKLILANMVKRRFLSYEKLEKLSPYKQIYNLKLQLFYNKISYK